MVHKEISIGTKTKPCKKNERWKTFNVQYILQDIYQTYKTITIIMHDELCLKAPCHPNPLKLHPQTHIHLKGQYQVVGHE